MPGTYAAIIRRFVVRLAEPDASQLVNAGTEAEDFTADALCAFLRRHGVVARVEHAGTTISFRVPSTAAASNATFACVCMKAAASYRAEAAAWISAGRDARAELL